jgi:hypothetical protein
VTFEFFVDIPDVRAIRKVRAWMVQENAAGSPLFALEPLDKPPSGAGIPVAEFFAGDLRTSEGEAVSLAAWRIANDMAFNVADWVMEHCKPLAAMNERLGRDALRLVLAKTAWGEVSFFLVRMLVARTLASTGSQCCLVIRAPEAIPPELLESAVAGVTLRFYQRKARICIRMRALLNALGGFAARLVLRRTAGVLLSTADVMAKKTGVLALQEYDELSLDRTVRSQPFWLDPDDDRLPFNIFVLPTYGKFSSVVPPDLARAGIYPLPQSALGKAWARCNEHSARRLRSEMQRAVRIAATAPLPCALAAAVAFKLVEHARWISGVAAALDIRCFQMSDPHMIHADAMIVAGEVMNIPVVANQYSNLAVPAPGMCTAADYFLLFAPGFLELWSMRRIRPRHFVAMGYPYAAAFPKLRSRSVQLRRALQSAGARTVACYFDESVQHHRFGVVSPRNHRMDLLALAQRVVNDATLAVIVKTQFEFNVPSKVYSDDPVFAAAKATGRWVELVRGIHRNVVLPAEAALASDIAIGHLVGATASLEAALAGCRSIMLDTLGQIRHGRELYEQADILYPSMMSALQAIDRFRVGDPSAAALGDWSGIIGELVVPRDERAGERMRNLICGLIAQSEAAA